MIYEAVNKSVFKRRKNKTKTVELKSRKGGKTVGLENGKRKIAVYYKKRIIFRKREVFADFSVFYVSKGVRVDLLLPLKCCIISDKGV